MAAVVARDGRILWSGASGKADMASGRALRPTDVFRLGSITKQFTAVLVLRLVEDERLSLDDNLGQLLPQETPAAWHAITVRQLLNHSSGVPNYTAQPAFASGDTAARPHTSAQLIDLVRGLPLDFAPGTDWRYSNSGYVLLSAIVEKLTGKPWYIALRERLTGPLGLTSIRCGCEPGAETIAGYSSGDKPARAIDMTVPSGAGALIGNVADLARWADALHGGRVLKPASYQAMITPPAIKGAAIRYGFGLTRGELRGLQTIGHNGGIFGFSSESLYDPASRLFVAVLANSDSGEPNAEIAARRLLASAAGVAFPDLVARPFDARALEPFFGAYRSGEVERSFFAKDGRLFMQRVGGQSSEVFHAGDNRFFYGPNSLSYFDLAKGADGSPVMTFHANGAVAGEAAPRVGPVPAEATAKVLSTAELDRLVGDYAVGPFFMTIARAGSGLTVQLTGQQPIPLEALGPREFRTIGVDARLVFEERDGKFVRVVLHQNGRTTPFERR